MSMINEIIKDVELCEDGAIDRDLGQIVRGAGGGSLDAVDTSDVAELFFRHRVLLLRGFAPDSEAFVRFSDRLTQNFSDYKGGGLRFGPLDRDSIGGRATVMTTTGHTQSFGLPLHGEMYYLKKPPQLLWFFCATPSKSAGETTICDGAALYARLPQAVKDFFAQHRLKYVRELVDGDWQATFMTDDLDEVARFCADNDLSLSIDRAAGIVRTEFVCSAVRREGGVPIFINNLALIYTAEQAFESGWAAKNFPGLRSPTCPIVVRTEDGARLPKEIVGDIQRTAETVIGDIRWQPGDIAMIDNRRILHGRRQTDGGKRAVLVRIGDIGFARA